jgi:hypothetical protein
MLYEKLVYMDVTAVKIRLHPLAEDYLFKHYEILRRIFSDVLGQLETDYISIALIDQSGQLIFLSSKPSIEQNLIAKNLLEFDGSIKPHFVYQDKPCVWNDLYDSDVAQLLYQYKQEIPGLKTGISIPSDFMDYGVVFSFGFNSLTPLMEQQIYNECEKLLAMGKFCLREIIKAIPLPNQQKIIKFKPRLELIINNQVNYENTSR